MRNIYKNVILKCIDIILILTYFSN